MRANSALVRKVVLRHKLRVFAKLRKILASFAPWIGYLMTSARNREFFAAPPAGSLVTRERQKSS